MMEGIWSTRSCDELTKSTLADAKVDTQPSILFGTFQEHSSALAKVDCSYETLDPAQWLRLSMFLACIS